MFRAPRRNKAIAPYGVSVGQRLCHMTAQGLLDWPVKPGNDSARKAAIEALLMRRPGMTRTYPATVLHVFARFSAPRSDSANTV
jgi:hypothetical protein